LAAALASAFGDGPGDRRLVEREQVELLATPVGALCQPHLDGDPPVVDRQLPELAGGVVAVADGGDDLGDLPGRGGLLSGGVAGQGGQLAACAWAVRWATRPSCNGWLPGSAWRVNEPTDVTAAPKVVRPYRDGRRQAAVVGQLSVAGRLFGRGRPPTVGRTSPPGRVAVGVELCRTGSPRPPVAAAAGMTSSAGGAAGEVAGAGSSLIGGGSELSGGAGAGPTAVPAGRCCQR